MPMNPEIKARWTAALRSGEYEQGRGCLNADGKLCCLGVLCELAVKDDVIGRMDGRYGQVFYGNKDNVLPGEVIQWAGIADDVNEANPGVIMGETKVSVAELNDGESGHERHSFAQLADLIDAQL